MLKILFISRGSSLREEIRGAEFPKQLVEGSLCRTGFATPSATLNLTCLSDLKRHGRGCKPRPAQGFREIRGAK
jgi:hypothetical protein